MLVLQKQINMSTNSAQRTFYVSAFHTKIWLDRNSYQFPSTIISLTIKELNELNLRSPFPFSVVLADEGLFEVTRHHSLMRAISSS